MKIIEKCYLKLNFYGIFIKLDHLNENIKSEKKRKENLFCNF